MSMIKNKELSQLGVESLNQKLNEIKKEIMRVNAQLATGSAPENPGQVRVLKKTIARIMTIITQKKNMANFESNKKIKEIKNKKSDKEGIKRV